MKQQRVWVLRWLWLTLAGHLATGLLLPWIAGGAIFEPYHRALEAAFWGGAAPAAARAQQLWWISLFGPTLQGATVWMAGLAWFGARRAEPAAWGWLGAGLLLWAPQDMLVSLRAGAWIHVWLDCGALVSMLPALAWLYRHDTRQRDRALHDGRDGQQEIAA